MRSDGDDVIKVFLVVAFLFGGVGVFVWQVYYYLRFNVWISVSVITALEWMKIGWAMSPSDWFGLFNVLNYIPLSISMVVFGFFMLLAFQS